MIREEMTDDFRILIAATEKTGNTWLKYLLAHTYELPTPYISQDFSETEADSLGNRWVTHQHFLPERPLLNWAARTQTHLITMIRHPADILVSLYHYCCNYPDHYKEDPAVSAALAADAEQRQATADLSHHVVDGELLCVLQERIACDVNISISWIRSGRSLIVRYEDLRVEPLSTLNTLTESIGPVSRDRVEKAIEACDIKVLRNNYAIDSRFFRRALIGEWRSVLPTHVLRRFAEEEPFRSQLSFLGYKVEVDRKRTKPQKEKSVAPDQNQERFDNGVPFVPILAELLENSPPQKRARWRNARDTASQDCFFRWANAAADEDPLGSKAIPRMTNLAVFVYKQRPDLQAAFPDIFDLNRLGYAAWFLRYAGHRYELDRSFLTPIALSWISEPSWGARIRRAFGVQSLRPATAGRGD
jgi:Sulfotransferase domain